MRLYEFLESNYFDGELVLNGHSYDNACSLCTNPIKCSDKAMQSYGNVLNAELKAIKGKYVYFENPNVPIEDMKKQAYDLLIALSGNISEKLYFELFNEITLDNVE